MKNMEMTIKQLADELGVSKPTIRNIVSKLGIQSKLRKVGNRYTLSDTVFLFYSQQRYNRSQICVHN